MSDAFCDELALLRGIAANPYDRARAGVYADWLQEHGRPEEEAAVRRSLHPKPARMDVNSMTVGELVGILLEMPLDATVIYSKFSDYEEMQPTEVKLIRAEDRRLIRRDANGYSDYRPDWWPDQRDITPEFVTVCHFPGN